MFGLKGNYNFLLINFLIQL
uniref:Uncharacterized protein n=1 Tax=Rhizophora mucronata TaxID=61149 RepID=A0A2P2IQ51_RHIMU